MEATPNFIAFEFVNEVGLNNAMSLLTTSYQELAADDVFFIPGLINQANLSFTFNNNLVVTLTMPNIGIGAFKVLFQTGAISTAQGNTTGVSTDVYNVDLTTFVPVAGSQTVYIVAQYAQVQQDPITILGPPPGHPDYSPNFVPNVSYTELVNTITVTATTTVPDNQVSIELARLTLTSGQTIVSAVNTN